MLVLVETAAGYGLFSVQNKNLVDNPEAICAAFENADSAKGAVRLQAWAGFKDNKHALDAATAIIESGMDKSLKKFLKKNVVDAGLKETLAVADKNLGGLISKKLGIECVSNACTQHLWKGIRGQMEALVEGLDGASERQMALGLSHTLNRFKLKFSPEKVDTMIIQAVGLLDDLDKELNNFAMRLREWYGWHFPELGKIVTDNYTYSKVVKALGFRTNAKSLDWTEVIQDDDILAEVKTAAEVSMGVEITEEDLVHIVELAERVMELTEYRATLADYLKLRMNAIAPNLTEMVGELVGARLISHAGSLMSLAKHPASTVQILGAEKALFRALKTKSQTPKYGLIYHATLVGQTQQKFKGKVSRVLAAKLSLSARVDALGEEKDQKDQKMQNEENEIGRSLKEYVEARARALEQGETFKISKSNVKAPTQKFSEKASPAAPAYNTAQDASKKRKVEEVEAEPEAEVEKAEKKAKKEKKDKKDKKDKKEKKEKA